MQKNDDQLSGQSFRAAALITGFLRGSLDHTEITELNNWIKRSEHNRQLFEELCSAEGVEKELALFKNTDAAPGWQRLQQKIKSSQGALQQRLVYRLAWKWAAALLIVMLGIWQLTNYKAKQQESFTVSAYGGDAAPGTKKAVLVLGNGQQVALQGADSLFSEAGQMLQRRADGSLLYMPATAVTNNEWNELQIPNGGEYKLVLGDGSVVWLNAASKLRYPVQFTGKERRIELLEGEAYFKVAKNKEKPFIVVAKGMEVRAIGTAFNVNTYADAVNGMSTTLTEGMVSVGTITGRHILEPGLQLQLGDGREKIVAADVEAVTGWKNGLFVFNNAPITEVMNQLARWYDVQLIYQEGFERQQFFTGEISRNVPVSKLLQMLELTGIGRFSINDKNITVQAYP